MEKKVYCLIGERCKCIKFSSEKHIPDVQTVCNRLIEAGKNDIVLQTMMHNKILILQKFDPDRNNKLCDIEDDEEIENKSEIKVLLFEKSLNLITESHIDVTSDISEDIQIGERYASPIDIKIIHTEPINPDNATLLVKAQKSLIDNAMEDKDVIYEECEKIENYDIAVPSTSRNSDIKNNHSKNITKERKNNLSQQSRYISYPAPLPPLSYDLQNKLETDGIMKAQRYFIAFWGQYLWQTTCTKPSKQDYSNLARSIVAAYPQLAGGITGNEIVRSQLSTWVRNHRAVLKKQARKKEDECKAVNFASVVVETPPLALTESDINSALKELEKKFVKHSNTSHVKRLLKVTMSVRRQWIENESNRIVDIVTKYPSLEHYEIMLFELLNIKAITEDVLFNKTNSMIDKLMKYFSVEDSTEKSKAYTMEQLYAKLRNKKLKKKYPALFTVKEVMSSTENLKTEKEEAPRIVMYMSVEGEIAAAYIVADETIRIIIPQPTVSKIIAGLLCAYYVWHLEYPTCYSNILEYIDHEILMTSLKSQSTVVAKFIRECDNAFQID